MLVIITEKEERCYTEWFPAEGGGKFEIFEPKCVAMAEWFGKKIKKDRERNQVVPVLNILFGTRRLQNVQSYKFKIHFM